MKKIKRKGNFWRTVTYFLFIIFFSFFWAAPIFAANREVNFVVSYHLVNFTGKFRKAIMINNQIPGPTLHFKEGDHVTINIYNQLDKGTAIHWHGVLVPWQMDGAEGVAQKAIPPGGVFHYRFTLYQAGTYWYHAHAGFQEQQGLYGAFLVDPPKPPHYKYTKDYVVILSDWSNTDPSKIFANLKKDGAYYSPRFPLQPSLAKFIRDYRNATIEERKKLIDDYKIMQHTRMGIYDISDVAYNAFLLNGQPNTHPWTAPVKVGDVVRLRFIGASSSTNFHVKIPGTTLRMVHVQGNDVTPYITKDFTITPGETNDVLVKIQKNKPYIIYAEAADTSGAAYGALITHPGQVVNYQAVTPFPEPLPVTREMMANMMLGMAHQSMKMTMNTQNMPTEPTITGDTISSADAYQATTVGTKYQNLKAAVKTNNPNKSVDGVIKMELFGYMDRFIWMINGLPEYKVKPIVIEPGKRYRIIFTNNSMMHHPMHIHGHWFILRNGHGAYDPLFHTFDVPPGATIVADMDADASGQWFFHCHHLYHMMAGMSRVFQYETILDVVNGTLKPESFISRGSYVNRPIIREDEVVPIDASLIHHPMAHPAGFYFASFLDVGEDPFYNAQRATFKGLYGADYNKLELFTNEAEIYQGTVENADMDIFYWRLISQFWAVKGGVNYMNQPAQKPYWQPGIGIEGLMPYFIDTDLRIYEHNNSVKFDVELSRDSQITNNFFIRLGIRSILATKTVTEDEVGSGLNQMNYIVRPYYRVMPGLSVFLEFEYEQNYGAFNNIRENVGESASENTFTLGLSAVF